MCTYWIGALIIIIIKIIINNRIKNDSKTINGMDKVMENEFWTEASKILKKLLGIHWLRNSCETMKLLACV